MGQTTLALPGTAAAAAGQRERGSTTLTQVILMPALFALLFLGMQGALTFQGRAIALAAAQEGARAAAGESGTLLIGRSTAGDFAASSRAGLRNTTVTGSRTAVQATITVSTNTVSVVPGWTLTIQQSASMPVERVTG